VPAYRVWFVAAVVSSAGSWMQRVAQDWLVLTVLTHNSGTAVGITTGLQFGPVLVVGPLAGSLADRFDRRRILAATQFAMGVLAAVLGLLVMTGNVRLWHVYLLAGLLGVVSAVDNPARQTFVTDLVEPELLPNAVSLNSASFHTGRMIGPALAGLLIHWVGTGPVFLINALSFGAVLIALLRMRSRTPLRRSAIGADGADGSGGRRHSRGIGEGLAYLRTRPDLVVLLSVVGVVATFTLNFQITMALMARLAFHEGPGQYGLLGSVMAIGGVAGSLMAARRRRPTLRFVRFSALGLGLTSGAACLMPNYWTFAASLVPVGYSALSLMTSVNASIQMSTAPQVRGRVMAIYSIVFMGGSPIGSPLIGWIGDTLGPRWTIGVGSITCLATVAVLWSVGDRAVTTGPGSDLPGSDQPGSDQPGSAELGSGEPDAVQPAAEEFVAHEADDVEDRVGDNQRHYPPGAPEPQREDHPHHGVPDERAVTLVEVVAAPQDGAHRHPRWHLPAESA
jgi:MFS family permease